MKTTELVRKSHRILVIDDNPTIHEDIRKILCPLATPADFALAEAALFGTEMTTAAPHTDFEIDSAYQGHQGLAMVEKAEVTKPLVARVLARLEAPDLFTQPSESFT